MQRKGAHHEQKDLTYSHIVHLQPLVRLHLKNRTKFLQGRYEMYRIFRKRLVLAALVPAVYLSLLLFLCSISAVSAQGRIDRFVANGDSAEASWSDGRIQGYVSVSSGGNVQNPETFLQYIIVEFSPCCTTLEAGSGLIPANDFKGSGTTSLNLNTNTSAVPIRALPATSVLEES